MINSSVANFKTGLNLWNGHKVFVMDTNLIAQDYYKNYWTDVFGQAILFTTHYLEKDISVNKEACLSDGSAILTEFANAIKAGESIICMSLDFYKHVTAEELEALLYHEEGHIVNGDMAKASLVKGAELAVIVDEWELAADAYAMQRVDHIVLADAVQKTFDYIVDNIAERFDISRERIVADVFTPALSHRMSILRAGA